MVHALPILFLISLTLPAVSQTTLRHTETTVLTSGGPLEPLSPLEVRVRGRRKGLGGGRPPLRAAFPNHRRGQPVPSRTQVSIRPPANGPPPLVLIATSTGPLGTLDERFDTSDLALGTYR